MDVEILRGGVSASRPWSVRACGQTFTFSDEAAAISFADKLKERVEADHRIPDEVIQRWTDELSHAAAAAE